MANRYANLVGSNKIKDEYTKINTGFDKVEQEMDAKPDKSIAQVNDVQMGTDDTLTIEGSTGITISTNPSQKKVIVTATGTSTPGPHGPSHNNDGADPIPDLQDLTNEFAAHKADVVQRAFNVKAAPFNAKGDGESDDTIAIQSAINACGLAGGGIVFFPPGVYCVSTLYVRYSNVTLKGSGMSATKLILNPMTEWSVIQIADYDNIDFRGTVKNVAVEDMQIDGNREKQKNGSDIEDGKGNGIRVEDAVNVRIERCDVHSCDGYGIAFVGPEDAVREKAVIRDCLTHNNNYNGIIIRSYFKDALIENCYSYDNVGGNIPSRQIRGIGVGGQNIRVVNCTAYGNRDYGFGIRPDLTQEDPGRPFERQTVITFEGCYAYDNGMDGFVLEGDEVDDLSDYILSNCWSVGNGRHGVRKKFGNLILNNCFVLDNDIDGVHLELGTKGTLSINSCHITGNIQDGVRVASKDRLVTVVDSFINNNGRWGIQYNPNPSGYFSLRGTELKSNGQNSSDGKGLLLWNTTAPWEVINCIFHDDETEIKQLQAIRFNGTNVPGKMIGNIFRDCPTPVSGTIPPGTVVDLNDGVYSGSAELDPLSLANGTGTTLTITVTGATLGDFVLFSAPYNLQGLTVTAYVSANNVVSVRIQNGSGSTVDLPSGVWKAKVIKG